jgi:hypothetical protein
MCIGGIAKKDMRVVFKSIWARACLAVNSNYPLRFKSAHGRSPEGDFKESLQRQTYLEYKLRI